VGISMAMATPTISQLRILFDMGSPSESEAPLTPSIPFLAVCDQACDEFVCSARQSGTDRRSDDHIGTWRLRSEAAEKP